MNTQKSRVFKIVLGLLSLGVLGVIIFPFFARSRESGGRGDGCQSNLKQIGLGMMQYVQDYDERFPPPASGGVFYGWAGMLQPYVKSVQLFQCSLEGHASSNNPRKTGYTDYWYNGNFSRIEMEALSSPASILLAGDGNDGKEQTDARYSKRYLPVDWITDTTKPAWRHPRDKGIGANYLYADGHVKLLRPNQISIASGQPNTFSIK